MLRSITVYCGSSDDCPKVYLDAAEALGGLIARQGRRLIYGSGCCGLMGRAAKGAKEAGGRIVGINARCYAAYGPYPGTDEYIMADTLAQRKEHLIRLGDGFIALPGGIGTLDELTDILVLIQSGQLDRPVGLLNVRGYYDGFLLQWRRAMFDRLLKEQDFARLLVAETPEELLRMMDQSGDQAGK